MEQDPSLHETPEAAYEEIYQELGRVATSVFRKLKGYHDSARPKTWAEVSDVGYILETMQELDDFLGV